MSVINTINTCQVLERHKDTTILPSDLYTLLILAYRYKMHGPKCIMLGINERCNSK